MPYSKEAYQEKFSQKTQGKKIWKFLNPYGVLICVDKEKHYLEMLSRRGFKFLGQEELQESNKDNSQGAQAIEEQTESKEIDEHSLEEKASEGETEKRVFLSPKKGRRVVNIRSSKKK